MRLRGRPRSLPRRCPRRRSRRCRRALRPRRARGGRYRTRARSTLHRSRRKHMLAPPASSRRASRRARSCARAARPRNPPRQSAGQTLPRSQDPRRPPRRLASSSSLLPLFAPSTERTEPGMHAAPEALLVGDAQAAGERLALAAPLPPGEAMAMLARRGFRPELGRPDLPFPRELDADTAERLTGRLSHYSFRLFLRGAIQRRGDFAPGEATRHLTVAQEKSLADALVELGLLVRTPRARYRFVHRVTSFGPTLEWYVARELRRRLGCDVATGVKFRAPGLGGDLDVVAAMEGKLIYVELKSSPPKHLTQGEVAAFFARVRRLRADVAVFAMDTALRLSDRVLPLLAAESGGGADEPRRIERDLWALTPHLYAMSAKADLMPNVCRVVGEGLIALGPRH